MPYKEALKRSRSCVPVNPAKKASYKVLNWPAYNQSLKKRGKLSLYFPTGDIKSLFINEESYCKGISGRQEFYQPAYVQVIYLHYRLFGWGMRQIAGYFEDMWLLKNLDIDVPSFGNLSDLFASISVEVKQFCEKLCGKIERGENISLIVDSTGFRFGKASDWYETKYGKTPKLRPWRKMHLSMDPDMNVHGVQMTDWSVSDIEGLDDIIPKGMTIDKLLGDGGYYSIKGVESLSRKGIQPVIPPPSDAILHGKRNTKWHDKIVQYIKEKGSVYAFHKKYGYGQRSLVEAQFSRIKRCIGSSLLTQRESSQQNEGIIIGNLLNIWNSFGRPVTVKIG